MKNFFNDVIASPGGYNITGGAVIIASATALLFILTRR